MKPFDLEKALLGDLVLLRNNKMARVVANISKDNLGNYTGDYPLIGLYRCRHEGDENSTINGKWCLDGTYKMGTKSPQDIVAMAPRCVFEGWQIINHQWRCVSANKNGNVHLHTHLPEKGDGEWIANPDGITRDVTGLVGYEYQSWETSLLARPFKS